MSKYLTPKQAANELQLSDLTLRKWRWEGKGPQFIKAGRKVIYRLQDIEEWVTNQIRRSTSDTGEAE